MSKPESDSGAVVAAVESELARLPPTVAAGAVAATALAMAREIDSPGNSATSKSMCAARLVEAMEKLRSLVDSLPTETRLDDIAKQRERRLAGRTRAAGQVGS